jgi:hypothetical protein
MVLFGGTMVAAVAQPARPDGNGRARPFALLGLTRVRVALGHGRGAAGSTRD